MEAITPATQQGYRTAHHCGADQAGHEFRGAGLHAGPYKFIGFGGIDVTKSYKIICFGDIDTPKPYKIIGSGGFCFANTGMCDAPHSVADQNS
jgi:hypothetical protein